MTEDRAGMSANKNTEESIRPPKDLAWTMGKLRPIHGAGEPGEKGARICYMGHTSHPQEITTTWHHAETNAPDRPIHLASSETQRCSQFVKKSQNCDKASQSLKSRSTYRKGPRLAVRGCRDPTGTIKLRRL